MLSYKKRPNVLPSLKTLLLLVIAVAFLCVNSTSVYAVQITNRRIELSSYEINATNVTHIISFNYTTSSSTGSLVFEYCSNSTLLDLSCTIPTGLDVSATTLTSQLGEVGYTVHPDTAFTTNRIVLTRPAAIVVPQASSYSLGGIVNPDLDQTYFVRVTTFASSDGSGVHIDNGGMAFHTSENYSVQIYVPPWLEFCVGVTISGGCNSASGNSLNLGDFKTNDTAVASSQFKANTNADNGYTVSISGSTLTSGNNALQPITTLATSQTGSNQYGLNLVANTVPVVGQNVSGPGSAYIYPDYDNANQFIFKSGDTIVGSNGTSDNNTFTVSYIVNISESQPAGVYSATMSFLCLATF